MPVRTRIQWALAVSLSLALLLAPALWNGFPLLEYDTGGYLARWYEGTLVPSRAVVYGLMLSASVPLGLWPVPLVQSALTAWVIVLVLRTQGYGERPWLLVATTAALTVFTTLAFLTAILLTDIFCGVGVLALYLLLLHGEALASTERYGLIALTSVASATHSATFALLLALLAAAGVTRLVFRSRIPLSAIYRVAISLVLGAALVFAADFAVTKRLAWTPGGFALSFGRMLQDGIVKKYLNEHCPDVTLRLCAHKDELPSDADNWFWANSLFDRLGRFDGLNDEMQKIALGSLIAYPGLQAKTAAIAMAQQLVAVHSGEGMTGTLWHTMGIINRFTPQIVPAVRAAHQQSGAFDFTAVNQLHYPLALLAMLLLPVLMLAAWRGMITAELGELATTVTLALLANAFVCGVLANPHDRYGARMVWLASFTVVLAVLSRIVRGDAAITSR